MSRPGRDYTPRKFNKAKPSVDTSMPPPATGRKEVPKPQKKPEQQPQRQQRPQQRRNNRGNQRPQRRRDGQPLYDAKWVRVVEHDVSEGVVTGFTEDTIIPCRVAIESSEALLPSMRIYVGDDGKGSPSGSILGGARMDKMSNSAKIDFPLILQLFVEEHGKHFVDAFFNKAGNLSLKQHAFELLAGIGNKKALQMAELRGSSGFSSMQELNEKCGIDSAELLARRFFSEVEDRSLQPRLIDHLFPVTA
ncbi:MAG: Uncharacterised protein [Candidatus Poseidoniaceae archaeon]|nr:MAG: Uncharacterised protein [Candidatus Poseidoniaceae archaeon]